MLVVLASWILPDVQFRMVSQDWVTFIIKSSMITKLASYCRDQLKTVTMFKIIYNLIDIPLTHLTSTYHLATGQLNEVSAADQQN